ncbi:hypothetical protein EG328_011585 [Venturia inaequalis]|uniref:Uncharacterized protein n=1 Tax=Venturia inaequalis TaxID=5025 RepID=A0A8H3YJV7_VENIN|nr:hypothetical protein EG328_011585 [Venturia inaequalis]
MDDIHDRVEQKMSTSTLLLDLENIYATVSFVPGVVVVALGNRWREMRALDTEDDSYCSGQPDGLIRSGPSMNGSFKFNQKPAPENNQCYRFQFDPDIQRFSGRASRQKLCGHNNG